MLRCLFKLFFFKLNMILQEGAQKKVPIMMCGNKSDLREEAEKQGRKVVNFEEGQRLARVGGLFRDTGIIVFFWVRIAY